MAKSFVDKALIVAWADRIERCLEIHGVPARVDGGIVAPRWVIFTVNPYQATPVKSIRRHSEDLAAALQVRNVRLTRGDFGEILVEVPHPNPQAIYLTKALQTRQEEAGGLGPMSAMLGLDSRGNIIDIQLDSPTIVHTLVSGTTGSGKTVLLRSIVLSLALNNRPRDMRLVLLGGGPAFRPFETLPHLLYDVSPFLDESAEVLVDLVDQMDERIAQDYDRPYIVVVIDELADLIVAVPGVQENLSRILQRGRNAGIHVVAATQKPTASVLGSLVTANFPARVTGRVTDARYASIATGIPESGAEQLESAGDFLLVAGGETIRFQAAYVDEQEIRQALRERGWTEKPHTATPTPPVTEKKEAKNGRTLQEQLLERGWEPDWNYSESCRALGLRPEGAPWYEVRDAVNALRDNGSSSSTG